jgi:hypothetical protein
MQTWSQVADPNLSRADLPGLASRLNLPDGSYQPRVVTETLRVDTRTVPPTSRRTTSPTAVTRWLVLGTGILFVRSGPKANLGASTDTHDRVPPTAREVG